MPRLMPGRVRQEGIELYEKGALKLEHKRDKEALFRVEDEELLYSNQEEKIMCSCGDFVQKNYCKHLAAVEYFLKNHPKGQDLFATLQEELEQETAESQSHYQASIFLDKVLQVTESKEAKYSLSAEAELGPFDQQFDWTLKISRYPDQRSYVIRDIAAFLRLVDQGGHYQIGKNYYEPLAFSAFDAASQHLIEFLWQLIPEKSHLTSDILINFGRNLRLPLSDFEKGLALLEDLSHFQLTQAGEVYSSLYLEDYSSSLGLLSFDVEVEQDFITVTVAEKNYRSFLFGYYILFHQHLYRLSKRQQRLLALVKEIERNDQQEKRLQIAFQEQEKLALVLSDFKEIGTITAPDRFQIRKGEVAFQLSRRGDDLSLTTQIDYDGWLVARDKDFENLPFSPHYRQLDELFSKLSRLGFKGRFEAFYALNSPAALYPFFRTVLPQLQALGSVQMDANIEALWVDRQPELRLESQGSLFEVSFDFEGIAADEIAAATEALLSQETHYTSQDGRVFVFDEESQRVSQTLQNLRATYGAGNPLQLDQFAAYRLTQTLDENQNIALSQDFATLVHHLAHPEEFPLGELPLAQPLREYQELGVRWLSMLDHHGFGGVLADDMGLGKTLQAIAFLAGHLKKGSKALILAPAGLIYNWKEEVKRFAPTLDVAVAYGSKEERLAILSENHQILVTSYASFRQDFEEYQKQRFAYLILDEAQVMKNADTKIAQQLREFEVGNCFALSGTPIENRLSELWSIFQIVLPGLFASRTDFNKLSAAEVSRTIQPFILRRKKEDVLLELPELQELTVVNELSDQQKAIYLAQLQQMTSTISKASESEINSRKLEILAGITRLRQICNSPSLFMDDYQGESGKLASLRDLLLRLKEGGHRVLIFSQFRTMLDLIEPELEQLGLTSYKLTGSTPANVRQQTTRAFNSGSRDAFLISLKAGGVGLNLIGADTVILVDLWWNPAVEAQAISRAHRMGQTQAVTTYRLITQGTIEQKIQELQQSKKDLVASVLKGAESQATLSPQEIKDILGIS